jgi:hypothetical protein
MADKVVAIQIKVEGTSKQKQDLAGLEKGLKELTEERRKLNKEIGKSGTLTDSQARRRAKLNNEIKATRTQLNKTRSEMIGLPSFTDKLGKSFSRLGSSISGAFIGLFAVQELFSIVRSGIKTLEEFELQMAKVAAITGATSIEVDLLTDSAKELGRVSQFTATEVGQLQEEFAKLGFSTAEILAASEATLQLATATGSDLAQSAEVAASTLNGFGLKAEETQKIVDLMAESFTSTPLDINRFQEAMKLVAPTAKSVDESLEDTTAKLGLLAKNGISGSIAGTQLSRVFIELNKKGISLDKAMGMVAGSADKLGTATDLVGDRGSKALLIFSEQSEELGNLEAAFASSEGEAKKMADTIGNTAVGASKKLDSAWEGLTLSLGDGTEDGLTKAKTLLSDFLNDITSLNEKIQRLQEVGADGSATLRLRGEATKFEEQLLTLIDKQDEFLKENVSNREALEKKFLKVLGTRKGLMDKINKAQEEGNESGAENLQIILNSQTKFLLSVKERIESIREQEVVSKAAADNAKTEAEIAAKEGKKLSKEELKDIEDRNKKILESNKKLAEQTRKVKQETTVLEIEDERKAEDKKLEIQEANAIREIDLTVATEQAKVDAKLSINAKFEAQRKALERSRREEDAKEAQDKLNKEQALVDKQKDKDDAQKVKDDESKKAFELKVREETIAIAEQTATALIDVSNRRFERQKTLELASLDARLEQGLISQADFEKEREAIERKAFQRQKKLELAQIAISLAREIASINASAAANPSNALTFGAAGLSQASVLTGLAVARSAVQAGVIASQSFAEGGYTGDGFGSADGTGFKQAGVVHEGEYVVPKNVLESQKGGQLVSALESMRMNRPQPSLGIGFANGGFASGGTSVDMVDLENRITRAVTSSIGAIQVVNVATDTVGEAVRVNNVQQEATFG